MNITILDNEENFIQFLDPELCSIVETIAKDGLRTLDFEYKFQDMVEDKKLFRIGNKLWIHGDSNLRDCLYVINTSVKQDIYQKNTFTCEMEEVLVELNYAPPFTQLELTSQNGFTFSTNNNSDEYSVVVNWQALNYWFGEYFNIGVVQKCLSDYNAKINISGTINLMNLLRYIEEESGNIFVTRYDKDVLNNTIHRYLDFLNPINVSKPWVLNLEYDFLDVDNTMHAYDSSDNLIEDNPYEGVTDEDDIVVFNEDYTPVINIDPTNIVFRITNGIEVLGTDGLVYDGTDEEIAPLCWEASDVDFENNNQSAIISLQKEKNYIGLTVNNKSFVLLDNISDTAGDINKAFSTVENTIESENERSNAVIPDDAIFEIYDTSSEQVVFATCINHEIGHVHEEVLDFGFNLENIELEIDETETFTAITPILSLENYDSLNKNDMSRMIQYWQNLSITKGETIPFMMEKVTVQAASLSAAKSSLGTSSRTNYWARPYHPQDSIDSGTPANSTWEFWIATSYWRAPFTKHAGELHVSTDSVLATEYTHIQGRPDRRDGRDIITSRPKMSNVETSSETVFGIYHDVCQELKDKQAPEFNLSVDVANLRNARYNDYELHDKVFVKIPDMNELLTARVTKTIKESHDIAKNTIELSNYSVSTVKQTQHNTFIQASNLSFKYPNKKNYTVRLVNEDYDNTNSDSIQYLANKLLTFQVYKVDENGQTTLTKTNYTKVTNAQGQATIPIKYDPGNYEILIRFGGDEEYLDCSMTIEVNVSGTKEVKSNSASKSKTKAKTTKKTSAKKTTNAKKYYTKYGISPDKKYIMGIGRSSASGESSKYGSGYYKTIMVRKCPNCGSTELYWSIFWGENEHSNWGVFPATGHNESSAARGGIFCKKCDAKYSIFGNNHNSTKKNLKVYKSPAKSSKSEAYTLKKGKMGYDLKKTTTKPKKNTSTKTRTIIGSPSDYVKKVALNIVGDSTGLAAAKKIINYVDTHVKYVLPTRGS